MIPVWRSHLSASQESLTYKHKSNDNKWTSPISGCCMYLCAAPSIWVRYVRFCYGLALFIKCGRILTELHFIIGVLIETNWWRAKAELGPKWRVWPVWLTESKCVRYARWFEHCARRKGGGGRSPRLIVLQLASGGLGSSRLLRLMRFRKLPTVSLKGSRGLGEQQESQ